MLRPRSPRYVCISRLPASLPRTAHHTPSTKGHHEAGSPSRPDARHHGTRARLPPLEDRPFRDVGRPLTREPRLVPPRRRDHGRNGLADGLAVAAPAARAIDPGPALVARARVLRGVHRRADPADVD